MNKCEKHDEFKDVNHYTHETPDTDCTCEGEGGSERGEGMGPATDPELVAKGSGAYDHPQPIATGPAADPELVAKGSGAYDHPQTLPPSGPAAE